MHFNDDGWTVVQQFQNYPLRPRHDSRIVVLNDPVPSGSDTLFIASLTTSSIFREAS